MLLVSALAAVGCQDLGTPPPTISADGGGGGGGGGNGGACEGPLGAPILDFSGMEACCSDENETYGEGHCLAGDKVPSELGEFLDSCAGGGVCVPDQFLSTGGAVPPTTCSAFGGDGVCLSQCVPQVREKAALLQADVCGGDQLCIPCISPIDNMPTGACDLRELATCEADDDGSGPPPSSSCDDPATCVYEAECPALIDPLTLPECAADAHCLDASLVPADTASQLAACPDASQLCVPDDFIRTGGKFAPLSCNSVAGAEGRCLSLALPAVAEQEALLPQDICGANEKCTPCYSPIDGSDTGACTLACDEGPTAAPVTFASCCEGKAACVPTSSIPEDQQEQLGEQECEDLTESEDLCVPNEIIAGGPFPACAASGLLSGDYTGVCLSDCLEFGLQGIAIKQGNCADDYRCAPCVNPLSGEPTGAPGCPTLP